MSEWFTDKNAANGLRQRGHGMADATHPIHIGENSPEQVAFKLLQEIALAEGIGLRGFQSTKKPDRKWILNTYAECLQAVRTPSVRLRG